MYNEQTWTSFSKQGGIWMNYIQLSVDYKAWHSGATYEEIVYLPISMWGKIKDKFQPYVYLNGLDGKHSEAKVGIDIEEVSADFLQRTLSTKNDGDELFNHVWEFLDDVKDEVLADSYLLDIQEEVENLRQYQTVSYEVHIEDKMAIDAFVNELQQNRRSS